MQEFSSLNGYAVKDAIARKGITKTNSTTLSNSFEGGLKINSISGTSVQDGTPAPDNQIAIHNAFDCVEMMQGVYLYADGKHNASLTQYVCNKKPIPCKSGDVIRVKSEKEMIQCGVVYYNKNGYLSNDYSRYDGQVRTDWEFTVPSDATHFNFNIKGASNITPSTVGKIELTINGKYVAMAKTVGKNLLDCRGLKTTTSNGVTYTPVYVNGMLEYINVNGTATANAYYNLALDGTPPTGDLVGYISDANVGVFTSFGYFRADNTYADYKTTNTSIAFSYPEDAVKLRVHMHVKSGTTVSNAKIYPMIRLASVEDATYEPYKESIATILLDAPLRGIGDAKDEIVKQNGVWGVLRRFAEETFDGSADERARFSPSLIGDGVSYRWVISTPNAKIFTDGYKTANILSSRYAPIPSNSIWAGMQGISVAASSHNLLIFSDELNDDDNATVFDSFSDNPLTVVYETETSTFEALDTDSQIALNSLETFNGATHISFDSYVKPTSEVEYGESLAGTYAIKGMLMAEVNAMKGEDLEVIYESDTITVQKVGKMVTIELFGANNYDFFNVWRDTVVPLYPPTKDIYRMVIIHNSDSAMAGRVWLVPNGMMSVSKLDAINSSMNPTETSLDGEISYNTI